MVKSNKEKVEHFNLVLKGIQDWKFQGVMGGWRVKRMERGGAIRRQGFFFYCVM